MLLLDTHVWWWVLTEPAKLSKKAAKTIEKVRPDQRAIATISIWEFAMMASKKRIELKTPPAQWLDYAVNKSGLRIIELSPQIAAESCNLPGEFHKDPADRIIVATARIHNLTIVTKDKKITQYSLVNSIW